MEHKKVNEVMSFKRALRHRFKSDKEDIKATSSKVFSDEDIFEFVGSTEDLHGSPTSLTVDLTRPKAFADNDSCGSPSTVSRDSGNWQTGEERRVFEEQLNQLQEQLMEVMIENQTLQNEIKESHAKKEKKSQKVHRSFSDRCVGDKPRLRSYSDLSSKEKPGQLTESGISATLVANTDPKITSFSSPGAKPKRLWPHQRLHKWLKDSYNTFIEDFTEEPVSQTVEDPDGDPLTVKTLKENIKRFGSEAKPYLNTVKGVGDILNYKYSAYTFMVFLVYMYAVWIGWALPLLLGCLSFRLFINYLRFKGWNVQFNFFETVEDPKESEDSDLGVREKIDLVMHVARKVQNLLGKVADSLEKVKSALTWRHPVASRQLLLTFTFGFVLSCVLPSSLLCMYAGLFLGVKLFITDYIYKRYPRVKQKYDSTYRLWQELPTDLEFEKKYIKREIDKYILPNSQDRFDHAAEIKSDSDLMDDRQFCELFSLPESECPLPGWSGGKRCTMINREKSLRAAFKSGRLYLTHSFLCFERTKAPSAKNIVIPLTDIFKMEKAKPYSWLPGGGMAIEIMVTGNDRSYIFGGIINRDEVFEILLEAGKMSTLAWSRTSSSPSPAE